MAKKNPVTYEEFDINVGLSYAGSEEQYVKFLKRYFSMIQGKTKRIKQCCEREDIEEYTMEVHALKSNSRLIGAISLADEAEYLEQCGMSGNVEEIKKKTPQLLKSFKALKELFSFIISKEEQEKGDLKISPEETKEVYKEIIEALEEFDIDTADYLLDSMMNYELSEAQSEYIFRAKKKVVDFAYDKAMEVMKIAISTL
ncbi:MAG: Hpt domain-containing protein [Lachnospiraceae bacterium]|jgi:HPt (histidine-containing phosphotransfer) domain-containing protein|nr:Hpt domain-containing protein [Lachnospiraceae bacterium]